MARKQYVSDDQGEAIFTFNETSVGMNGNNRKRTDVQLIQFFLRQFYKAHPELFVLLPKTSKGGSMILIDGFYGGQTGKGIWYFQKHHKNKGFSIQVDGLVNVGKEAESSISQTVYTINYLNSWFMKWSDPTGNVEKHPDCIAYAPELQAELCAGKMSR